MESENSNRRTASSGQRVQGLKIGLAASFGDTPFRDIGFLKDFAKAAEEYGFSSLWAPEHIVFFTSYSDPYPHTPDGNNPWRGRVGLYDPLMVCAVAACVTSRLRLGSAVLIVPERPALLTAKEIMTLDHIAEGRFEFGAGLGWSSQEYAALGVSWQKRGKRFDEYLDAIRVAWSAETAEFHGEFLNFENVLLQPHPLTEGGPPILIGGNSDFAIRRALHKGDGWLGVANRYEDPVPLLTRLRAALEKDAPSRGDGFLIKLSLPYSPQNSDEELFELIQTCAKLGLHELIIQLPIRSKQLEADMRHWSELLVLSA